MSISCKKKPGHDISYCNAHSKKQKSGKPVALIATVPPQLLSAESGPSWLIKNSIDVENVPPQSLGSGVSTIYLHPFKRKVQ